MSLQVLLVDDDDMNMFLHQTLAQVSGLSPAPVCLQDGQAALDYLLAQYQPGHRYLVLLDINMPVMNGWAFLSAIGQQPFADALAVIMVTSSGNQADREQASQYRQVIGYVEKPLSLAKCEQIKLLPQVAHLF